MTKPTSALLLLFGLSFIALEVQAVEVSFTTFSLGGDDYRYEYTIQNDGSLGTTTPVKLLDLLFDPTMYSEASLSNTSAPSLTADWNMAFLASAPSVPAAFDISTSGLGIPVGSQLGGFAVQFHWLGSGLPGAQPFEIYDPNSLDLIASGITSPVPEPDVWVMMLAGGLLVSAWRGKKQCA
jgi:hypothetical protein